MSDHTPGGVLSLQSFLRKGVSLGYVGLNENIKDLKVGHGRTKASRKEMHGGHVGLDAS